MSHASAPGIEAVAHSLQLAELFESLEDVLFWIKDREGRYCRANRAFLLHFALNEPGQAVGKTDYDLSPAFLADQFRFDDEQILKGHRVVNRIERVGQADHTASWNVTNKIPICDPRGSIVGTAGTTRRLGAEGCQLIGAHSFEPVVAHILDRYREHISNCHLRREDHHQMDMVGLHVQLHHLAAHLPGLIPDAVFHLLFNLPLQNPKPILRTPNDVILTNQIVCDIFLNLLMFCCLSFVVGTTPDGRSMSRSSRPSQLFLPRSQNVVSSAQE